MIVLIDWKFHFDVWNVQFDIPNFVKKHKLQIKHDKIFCQQLIPDSEIHEW